MAKKKKASWFQTGKAGEKRSAQVDAEAQARRERTGPMRFYLKPGESAKVTFLDNPQFFLSEHNLKIGNSYYNFFTCLSDFDTCPICESGDSPSYIVVGTIINHKPWEDRDGNEHKNQKMLFVAKGRARQRILKRIEQNDGDLKYCVLEMTRGTGQTECATGEDFAFLKRLTAAQVKKLNTEGEDDWLKAVDYEKVFEPKDPDELRKIVGGAAPVGADDSGSDDPESDDQDDSDAGDDDGGGEEDDLSIDDLI
jgi:hypothetical protein